MDRIDTGYFSGNSNNDPHYDGPGWYFYDEAEQINGPFDTKENAEAALEHYVEHEL